MSVPINQGRILYQCIRYLEIVSSLKGSKYRSEDIKKFIDSYKSGQCGGLTALWLIRKIDHDETLFLSALKEISDWDGNIKSLFEGKNQEDIGFLEGIIEQFINDMSWGQQTEILMQTGLKTGLKQGQLVDIYNIVKPKNTKEELVLEYSFPFVFDREELIFALENCIFEEKMIYLNSVSHAIGIIKRGGKYIVYDPNDDKGEKEFDSVESLELHIENCLYRTPSASRKMAVSIKSFSKGESKEVVKYPDPQEMISMFIKENNDIDRRSDDQYKFTPLIFAANLDDAKFVDLLIKSKADVNNMSPTGATPLSLAVSHEDKELTKILLDAKAYVNARDDRGFTPLHIAANHGNTELVKILLDAKAEKNAKNVNDTTSLHLAVNKGNKETVKILLEANAEVDAMTKQGATSLNLAIDNRDSEMVKLLLEAKSDPNIKTGSGSSSLHDAVSGGQEEIVKLLIDAKANMNATDAAGQTPLHIAIIKGKTDIVNLLIKAKVDITEKELDEALEIAEKQKANIRPTLDVSKKETETKLRTEIVEILKERRSAEVTKKKFTL